ncbi:DNA-3-methyladenine glycosylase 2 family protein [Gulosibacter molinativorax]|uniref:DNA-3-methyladenine glycosylase II n=1 Tax=Gulosibacter molinativorax TaxID=256821 RepID=A0ABT7C7Q8_9MICO|nr:AlkA N-terminal domain-containing protein [Gulosibacter molinativorax]MDJ1371245.1 DNA-3-methyladenine glycosylase 2 family protein [Gulosibacter molinativorax]QUY63061.1 DNA-3-methyladenine glycosylase 2 [Gulosibacter molinativorax]
MTTAPASFDERYRAVEARDRRFDGQFIMAVRSTGIYCRPSCPARTPKRANVTFYPTSAAAHEAGFRACKRCLPEAAPGSPEWDTRRDVVGRAMRLIADGIVEREGVDALAGRLGYSSRHLTRVLSAELGAGPLALARSQRAQTARMLLTGTSLGVSEVAFSAGFGSIRQCNDTIREVFGMTPSELRSRSRGVGSTPASGPAQAAAHSPAAALSPTPTVIDLVLPARAPLDIRGVFRWMAERAVAGMERATEASFARTLALPSGPASFEVREDAASPGRVRLRARVTELADLGMLVARIRRLFDLDADPLAIDAALAQHPEIAPLVAGTPGIRVPGAADPHEMLIRAMIGQQVSVASARTALTRLVDALGERIESPERESPQRESAGGSEDATDRLFPTMATIAARGHEVLRGPGARIRAITETAGALADGSLTLTVADDGDEQRAALLARPGIGPWTADYVRMRVVGDPDVLLPGDSALRAGAQRAGVPSDAKGLIEWAARFAPWRSYLMAHLWRVHASLKEDAHVSATTGN